MNSISQRDAFWGRLYQLAKDNRDILAIIADMGAPALDAFRSDLTSQYIDVGIAEQQGVAVAAGLAMSGKKPFLYAIAPFVALRCYEHTRVNLASMNLPVTLVGVGAGCSYDDSGPTHHAVDDLSVLRILPRLQINNVSDSTMARAVADLSVEMKTPNYVRLDRETLPAIYEKGTDFSEGIHIHKEGGDVLIAATGNMVHRALEVARAVEDKMTVSVLDVYRLPINGEKFLDMATTCRHVVTMEEHTLPGGFGSAVCELLADAGLLRPVKRIGMDFCDGYCYRYGGREAIQSLYGLDKDAIVRTLFSL